MKKRYFGLFLLLLTFCCLFPHVARAWTAPTEGDCGINARWSIRHGVLTIEGTGRTHETVFWHDDEITSVVIEDGITSIDDNFFDGLKNLEKASIPASVTEIGNWAFGFCTSLQGVTIRGSDVEIGMSAFAHCTALKEVNITGTVSKIDSNAFQDCSSLDMPMPSGLLSLGSYAFSGCSSLRQADLPETLTDLGDHVFESCIRLKNVVIRRNVSMIGMRVFSGCSNLESVEIPVSIDAIFMNAFSDCTALKTVWFAGTQEQWDSIMVSEGNEALQAAEIRFPEHAISYNLEYKEVPVYESEFQNGAYTIPLEDDPFFPFEVQFTSSGISHTEWFMDENDSVEVDGHTFYVSFEGKPRSLYFRVGDELLRGYPDEKYFSNNYVRTSSTTVRYTMVHVNLRDRIWSELKNITLGPIPDNMTAWAAEFFDKGGDNYTEVDASFRFDAQHGYDLIIGSNSVNTPDYQYSLSFDAPEIAYRLPPYNQSLLRLDFYSDDSERQSAEIINSAWQYEEIAENVLLYGFYIGDVQKPLLSMDFGTEELRTRPDIEVTIYEGDYESEAEAISAGARDITSLIWRREDMSHAGGYPMPEPVKNEKECAARFTLVFKSNHVTKETLRLGVYTLQDYVEIDAYHYYLYSGSDYWREPAAGKLLQSDNWETLRQDVVGQEKNHLYQAYALYDEDDSLEGPYYLSLYAKRHGLSDKENHPYPYDFGIPFIKKATLGYLTNRTELDAAPDIKEQLFSDASAPGGGYPVNFSNGAITFTILDVLNETYYVTVQLLEADIEVDTEEDTYAAYRQDDYFQFKEIPAYGVSFKKLISYSDDSYYYHGYQTEFCMGEHLKLQEGQLIYPRFDSNPLAKIYAGQDTASGVEQISGKSVIAFHRNQPIRYSAAMGDGIHLKNYWVKVVTPEYGGAKLFVNAATNIDDSHRDADEKGTDGKGLPVREVFFDSRYNYHHDILIANTGDKELTGLSVKLVGDLNDESISAKNVRLDDNWTLGTNDITSLAPFDRNAVTFRLSGGWDNMAKIRLLPITDENGVAQEGLISGYLIITSDNGGSMTVKLTGEAGEPHIVTETLETVKNRSFQAVRFVHYSTFLQTSSMYAKDKVRFTLLDGELPKGVTEDMDVKLLPNGELYGVPAETGTYEFVVRATFYGDENCYDDKTYTLIVADNTDANVSYGTGISDYQLLQNNSGDYNPAVGYDPASGDLILHSDAPFNLFVDKLVLDGEELRPGIDYTARDGSVIAQIRNLASRLSGNANHTLSLENRAGGKTNQATKLTRTSVNIRTTEQVSSSKSGGSSTVKTVTKTPSRTAYAIHVSSASNGTVNVSAKTAVSGKNVTITPSPKAGYTVQSVTVSGENIPGSVNVRKSGGKYTFTMPAKQVRVRVRFTDGTASGTAADTVKTMPDAVDVKSTDWYYSDAVWAYDRGILRGYQDHTFRAGTLMHWVSAVVTLERMDGVDVAAYDTGAEDGLNNSAWYVGAARWAVDNGIAPAPFGEYAAVTRGQYAVMLRNYLRFSGVTVTVSKPVSFPDGDRMTDAEKEAFQILSQAGVFQGDSSGAMLPGNTLTRAHLAATLHRLSDYIIGYWEKKANA